MNKEQKMIVIEELTEIIDACTEAKKQYSQLAQEKLNEKIEKLDEIVKLLKSELS